jgi:hypothetical protein
MQLDHASQEKIEQRYKPRRIPIAIKSADVIPERSNDQKLFSCDESSPWTRFSVTSHKGKLGRIQLAQDSIASTKREADKQHTVSRSKLPTNLGKTSHGNVVKILGAFMDQDVVSLAYEVMDLTLGQLRYQTGLEEKYISYICREACVMDLLLSIIMPLTYVRRSFMGFIIFTRSCRSAKWMFLLRIFF